VQVATRAAASAARGFGLRGALGPFGQPCSDSTVRGAPSTFRCDRRRTRVPNVADGEGPFPWIPANNVIHSGE
jgi:hypothetical protein